MIIILMGVSGSGKTTIGKLLSKRLQIAFVDADDFHPQQNINKMRAGIPLTDNDRKPWLETLRKLIEEHCRKNESLILACSALKAEYRRALGVDQQAVRTVYLKGGRDLLQKRMQHRKHFFPPALIDSQLSVLEEPDSGLILYSAEEPQVLVEKIVRWVTES
jgi:gluconokinase